MQILLSWLRNREGVTALEYSLIVAGIAMGIITVVFLLGDDMEALFNSMASSLGYAHSKI